ncbi:hypothetical protein ABFT23_19165 [Nocardioides sp. C4-1]|uniref:hypothetical protein n=1 Tax=Nocardioides sp. C4-1 TaxID=3151851 RepID=UPI003264C82F
MKHPVRRAALLTPVLVAGIALNGCGVADEQARPGLAAEVGGTAITTSDVDDETQGICDFLDAAEGQQAAFPKSAVRRLTFETAVRRVAAEKVLDELGLDLPSDVDTQASAVRQQLAEAGDADDAELFADGEVARLYVAAAAGVIGAELLDDGTSADDEAAAARGVQALQEWLVDNDVDLNPAYGVALADDGTFTADEGLSIPVSDAAVAAQAEAGLELLGGNQEEVAAAAEGLPADQVCGPTA